MMAVLVQQAPEEMEINAMTGHAVCDKRQVSTALRKRTVKSFFIHRQGATILWHENSPDTLNAHHKNLRYIQEHEYKIQNLVHHDPQRNKAETAIFHNYNNMFRPLTKQNHQKSKRRNDRGVQDAKPDDVLPYANN